MEQIISNVDAAADASADAEASALGRALKKAGWRFVPLLIIASIFNNLDRVNVGFAGLTMRDDLGLTATQFGYGAGIMFLTYCLFEVPSNLAMHRFGARIWLARIMITWGIVAAATTFVVGPNSFYAVRLVLGIAEAGFFPGVIFFLTIWFPKSYRTRMLAWFIMSVPLASFVGAPLSIWLLQITHGWGGMAGWKWMFILEGLPSCLLGVIVLFLLADEPAKAKWLSAEEKLALQTALATERRASHVNHAFLAALKDPRVYILSLTIFGFTLGSYGIAVWLPQILKLHGVSIAQTGWLAAIPYLFGIVGLIVWSVLVDRRGRPILNLILSCGLAGVALGISTMFGSLLALMVAISVALIGITAARAIFFTIPSRFLTGQAAAGGLALINCIGAFGGFVGPSMVGFLKDKTGSFEAGINGMAIVLVVSALMPLMLRFFMRDE
jgi:ACS family tartrate transporter-like MFS transporter